MPPQNYAADFSQGPLRSMQRREQNDKDFFK
jgi:hypothetical protein